MAQASPHFQPCDTAARRCLPARLHLRHDRGPEGARCISIATCWRSPTPTGGRVLRATAEDRFIGSPPLAFTFGLGGLVVFPLAVGASSVLIEKAGPGELLEAIGRFRATILFTAPTAYRAMLGALPRADISSLRIGVSAGETLPLPTFQALEGGDRNRADRRHRRDGDAAYLHRLAAEEIRPGATGRVVPGYRAEGGRRAGREAPRGTPGRPCRARADRLPLSQRSRRQTRYVRDGWNLTGDTSSRTRTATSGSRRAPTT